MKLDTFTRAYLRCVLFTDTDESDDSGGEPLDRNYGIEDFAPDAVKQAIADCAAFQTIMAHELAESGSDDEQAGHDFWFTRCGHGVGFWDRGYDEEIGDALSDMAKRFGEVWSGIADDGTIYLTEGRDPAHLLRRYQPVIPSASQEQDTAVEVLIHVLCKHVALGLDVLNLECASCGGVAEGNTCCFPCVTWSVQS